jgi:uncharacterized protein DUF2442
LSRRKSAPQAATARRRHRLPQLLEARYIGGYSLCLRFSDGAEGPVDFSNELRAAVFEPLRAMSFFRRFAVHPELKTLIWPNGAYFPPEYLRARLRSAMEATKAVPLRQLNERQRTRRPTNT